MAGDSEAEDRTEAPTPRRLQKAREEGQVPLSHDAASVAALALASVAIVTLLPQAGTEMMRSMRGLLAQSSTLAPAEAWGLLRPAMLAVLPVAGAAALGGVAATLAQTGGMFSARGLSPQLSRLSPISGLKRLFGIQGGVQLLRSILKLAVVAAALWAVLPAPTILRDAMLMPPGALGGLMATELQRLLLATLAALVVLGGADFAWVRFRHLRQLRMSREDLKEEHKDSEGDPHIKAKRRQLQQQASRKRMMAAVPKAAVVVTNPTHYAVALAYEKGGGAPRIVAKGVDAMAARIREAARDAGVPLMASPPLARALYKLELDTEIPPEHYAAVAEIIAFVWRRRG